MTVSPSVTIDTVSNVNDQTKANSLNDIFDVFNSMGIKPATPPDGYNAKAALTTDRMRYFTHIEFGKDLKNELLAYADDKEIRPYIKPMVEYCDKMDHKVNDMIAISRKDLDAIISKNMNKLISIVSSGSFGANTESLTSLFSLFTSDKKTAKYFAKHFPYFKNNMLVQSFVKYILNKVPTADINVDVGTPDYLKGKTITIVGNVGQCELIRIALTFMNKIRYSNDINDVESGYANSATAIGYLYNQINLPIPLNGTSMYLSGKAVSPFSEDDIKSTSEDELMKSLYAGDVLLYQNTKDTSTTAIRHVEMYAGDGLMIGHSGGASGSTMGFHASKFRKSFSNLSLYAVRRFIKMADTTVYTMTINPDKGIITIDGEDVSSTKTSLFEKIGGFITEVISRLWNGLTTGEWDTDYSKFWEDSSLSSSGKITYNSPSIDAVNTTPLFLKKFEFINKSH